MDQTSWSLLRILRNSLLKLPHSLVLALVGNREPNLRRTNLKRVLNVTFAPLCTRQGKQPKRLSSLQYNIITGHAMTSHILHA